MCLGFVQTCCFILPAVRFQVGSDVNAILLSLCMCVITFLCMWQIRPWGLGLWGCFVRAFSICALCHCQLEIVQTVVLLTLS